MRRVYRLASLCSVIVVALAACNGRPAALALDAGGGGNAAPADDARDPPPALGTPRHPAAPDARVGPDPDGDAALSLAGRHVLLVRSSLDQKVGSEVTARLTALGMDVIQVDPSDVSWRARYPLQELPTGSTDDIDLVIVGTIATYLRCRNDLLLELRYAPRPVIAFYYEFYGWLGMTSDRGDGHGVSLEIVAPGHPLAAGYEGQIGVGAVDWGKPFSEAILIAGISPSRASPSILYYGIFAYPSGAALQQYVGAHDGPQHLPAPAKRVAFGLFPPYSSNNPVVWRLFDAAVAWALENGG